MDYISLIICVCFLIGFVVYGVLKSHTLNVISKAMQNKQYDEVIELGNKKIDQKLLGSYVCDLYILRALLNKKADEEFKSCLLECLDKPYSLSQRKDILDIYYYHFIFLEDKEWSTKLLEIIRETNDSNFIRYNEEAYEVMINKNSDLLDDMIYGIENKKYSGFGLGVAVYMVGMQYLYLGDKENARVYMYNSLSCFHEKSFFYGKAKADVDRLTDELGEEELTY